jgi:hypothetical protein
MASAIQALKPGEHVDILASIVPLRYNDPGFDVTPSPYTPFAGPVAGRGFLRFTRKSDDS